MLPGATFLYPAITKTGLLIAFGWSDNIIEVQPGTAIESRNSMAFEE